MTIDSGPNAIDMKPEVLGQVDNQNTIQPGAIFVEEFFSLTMTHTKKDNVYIAMPFRVKTERRVPDQVLMYRINRFAGVAFAMNKPDSYVRMPDQKADHLPACITRTADNTRSYLPHIDSFICASEPGPAGENVHDGNHLPASLIL
jgi:hypothetical protein